MSVALSLGIIAGGFICFMAKKTASHTGLAGFYPRLCYGWNWRADYHGHTQNDHTNGFPRHWEFPSIPLAKNTKMQQ